jgi:hypothetical protein
MLNELKKLNALNGERRGGPDIRNPRGTAVGDSIEAGRFNTNQTGSRWIKVAAADFGQAAGWKVGDIPTGREEACATGLPLPPSAAPAPNGQTRSSMVVDSRG